MTHQLDFEGAFWGFSEVKIHHILGYSKQVLESNEDWAKKDFWISESIHLFCVFGNQQTTFLNKRNSPPFWCLWGATIHIFLLRKTIQVFMSSGNNNPQPLMDGLFSMKTLLLWGKMSSPHHKVCTPIAISMDCNF